MSGWDEGRSRSPIGRTSPCTFLLFVQKYRNRIELSLRSFASVVMDFAEPITVSSRFDGGNGEAVAIGADRVVVKLVDGESSRPLHAPRWILFCDYVFHAEPLSVLENKVFKQWFYFRVSGVKTGRATQFSIANAGDATFTDGWHGYNVRASYDRKNWFCVPTTYEAGALSWSLDCPFNQVYFAYFEPYSQERHADLVARCSIAPGVHVRSLGKTLDGRDIDLVTMGTGDV